MIPSSCILQRRPLSGGRDRAAAAGEEQFGGGGGEGERQRRPQRLRGGEDHREEMRRFRQVRIFKSSICLEKLHACSISFLGTSNG